jgi:hypothetical protein
MGSCRNWLMKTEVFSVDDGSMIGPANSIALADLEDAVFLQNTGLGALIHCQGFTLSRAAPFAKYMSPALGRNRHP